MFLIEPIKIKVTFLSIGIYGYESWKEMFNTCIWSLTSIFTVYLTFHLHSTVFCIHNSTIFVDLSYSEEGQEQTQAVPEETLEQLADKVLGMADFNSDGFVDYTEFKVMAQQSKNAHTDF